MQQAQLQQQQLVDPTNANAIRWCNVQQPVGVLTCSSCLNHGFHHLKAVERASKASLSISHNGSKPVTLGTSLSHLNLQAIMSHVSLERTDNILSAMARPEVQANATSSQRRQWSDQWAVHARAHRVLFELSSKEVLTSLEIALTLIMI